MVLHRGRGAGCGVEKVEALSALKWVGTALAIVGALAIALNLPYSGWAFVCLLYPSSAADASGGLAPEDLERLGDAAWWTGHSDEYIDARERAFAGYLEQQEPRRASFVAFRLANDHQVRGAQSVAFGWLGQEGRLLATEPECPGHGYLA